MVRQIPGVGVHYRSGRLTLHPGSVTVSRLEMFRSHVWRNHHVVISHLFSRPSRQHVRKFFVARLPQEKHIIVAQSRRAATRRDRGACVGVIGSRLCSSVSISESAGRGGGASAAAVECRCSIIVSTCVAQGEVAVSVPEWSEANVSTMLLGRRYHRMCSNGLNDLVHQHERRFAYRIYRSGPLRHRFHNSPIVHVGMALPYSTSVNNIPDRSLRRKTIEMPPQGTVLVTSNEPVMNQPNSS